MARYQHIGPRKLLSAYGHTLLQDIVGNDGISEQQAWGKRQATLGSLFYNGWIRVTSDPKRKFVATDAGIDQLTAYVNANVNRENVDAGWSRRLPDNRLKKDLEPPATLEREERQEKLEIEEAGQEAGQESPAKERKEKRNGRDRAKANGK